MYHREGMCDHIFPFPRASADGQTERKLHRGSASSSGRYSGRYRNTAGSGGLGTRGWTDETALSPPRPGRARTHSVPTGQTTAAATRVGSGRVGRGRP